MRRIFQWLSDSKHPLRGALLCLVIGLTNAYGAIYIRTNSIMRIFDWAFALGGIIGFVLLVLEAVSDFFYKADE
jgi:hypothetical protein